MKKHFFIIDDDEEDVTLFIEAIRLLNPEYKCSWVSSGGQALMQLPHIIPDLIFVDYHMPCMNGLECIKAIKELPSCRSIPIVLHSTKMASDIREKGLGLGAAVCMHKPESPQQLTHFINAFVQQCTLLESYI
jgi:CheY-like chemotaxis protein